MNNLEVKRIENERTKDLILNVHYAQRMPSISYAFGLFDGEKLLGVCTFGKPPSATLCKGIAGDDYTKRVLELNRLVLYDNEKNHASYLISRAMKLLPRPSVVVSFADKAQKHSGVVYQATNFIYTGLSAERTNWTVKGKEGKHSFSIADESRGQADRVGYMRKKYGDDFTLEPRSRKHRYIYFVGSAMQRKAFLKALVYPVRPYPLPQIDRTIKAKSKKKRGPRRVKRKRIGPKVSLRRPNRRK